MEFSQKAKSIYTKNTFFSSLISTLYVLSLHIFKSIKFSFILGSKWAFFSASQALAPISGFYAPAYASVVLYLLRVISTHTITGLTFSSAVLYHIPTLCGALYISKHLSTKKNPIFALIIPTLAITLFLLHPVGQASYFYTLYWFVPILLTCINHKSIFLTSLASTLTTHAVGSIIWLYTKPVDTNLYKTLFSIVWAERLLFALSLTAAYYTIEYAYKGLKTLSSYYMPNKQSISA